MEDDYLYAPQFVDDDRCSPRFRAGAGSSGHCDDGNDSRLVNPGPVVADVFEIPQRAVLPHHQRHGFCGIKSGPATEGDHPVMITGPESVDPVFDIASGRISLDFREQSAPDIRAGACRQRIFHHG